MSLNCDRKLLRSDRKVPNMKKKTRMCSYKNEISRSQSLSTYGKRWWTRFPAGDLAFLLH